MCVLIFSKTFFFWNLSHSKKNWARYDQKCVLVFIWSTCCSCQILMKHEFSPHIFEKRSSNFMKIRPVGAELFRSDGQTGMTKLIVAFRNFANAPKTSCFWGYVEIDDRSILSSCWPHRIRLKHLKGSRKYDSSQIILLLRMPAEYYWLQCLQNLVPVHFITSSCTFFYKLLFLPVPE